MIELRLEKKSQTFLLFLRNIQYLVGTLENTAKFINNSFYFLFFLIFLGTFKNILNIPPSYLWYSFHHLLFERTRYSRRSARRQSGGQLPPGQTSWGAPRQVNYTVFPVKISCLKDGK